MNGRRTVWTTVYSVEARRSPLGRTWQLRLPQAVSPIGYSWTPPTDVFQTEDGGLVRVEIAGLSSAPVDLTYAGGRLHIAGSRSEPECGSASRCALKEIASGRYHVEVDIPWRVDTRRVEVSYADGFLTVVLPADRSGAGSVGSAPAA